MTTDNLPLSGIRILDLSWVLAGPIATAILGSLGAEVWKVESRVRPDQTRTSTLSDGDNRLNTGRSFNTVNHSKKSFALNLRHPEAAKLLHAMASVSDVLVENFATGALERMGIDIQKMLQDNPRLIVVSSSGFGRTGPVAKWVAYGNNVHAASGLTNLVHYSPEEPLGLLGVWSDPVAAYSLAFAVVTALREREQTGRGGRLDLSMLEASVLMLASHLVAQQLGDDGFSRPVGLGGFEGRCYLCAGDDDEWIAIAAEDDQSFSALCAVMGAPDMASDLRFATREDREKNREELDRIISRWTRSMSREEVADKLKRWDIAYGESWNTSQSMEDPQIRARNFIRLLSHPDTGVKPVLRPPWIRNGDFVLSRAPRLGEHTYEILREGLGYDEKEVERLREIDRLLY